MCTDLAATAGSFPSEAFSFFRMCIHTSEMSSIISFLVFRICHVWILVLYLVHLLHIVLVRCKHFCVWCQLKTSIMFSCMYAAAIFYYDAAAVRITHCPARTNTRTHTYTYTRTNSSTFLTNANISHTHTRKHKHTWQISCSNSF
jgi:hypothetical protein